MASEIDLGIAGIGPATLLARGGSAYVYLAEQLDFGRKVAVKVLFNALEDDTTFRRFDRECRAIGAVSDHPNIVVVHGRGLTDDERPYLIMEHRAGGSLAQALTVRGRFTEAETIRIGIRIGSALDVAHRAGVLHRDVKPANILLSTYNEPALADFGIARIEGSHKTTEGIFSASVVHASRELLDAGNPTPQSDIYALGSTMFELVTGKAAYADPDDLSMWAVINRVLGQDPPDPREFGVSDGLATVLAGAMNHDPDQRQRRAADLVADLEALQSGRGTADQVTAVLPIIDTTEQPTIPPSDQSDRSDRSDRRGAQGRMGVTAPGDSGRPFRAEGGQQTDATDAGGAGAGRSAADGDNGGAVCQGRDRGDDEPSGEAAATGGHPLGEGGDVSDPAADEESGDRPASGESAAATDTANVPADAGEEPADAENATSATGHPEPDAGSERTSNPTIAPAAAEEVVAGAPGDDPAGATTISRTAALVSLVTVVVATVVIAVVALQQTDRASQPIQQAATSGGTRQEQSGSVQPTAVTLDNEQSAAGSGPDRSATTPESPASEPLVLLFARADLGPLLSTEPYLLAVRGGRPDASYRIVVDNKPITELAATLPPYYPEPGRHRLQVQAVTDRRLEISNVIEIYVSGQPATGYRANLSAIRSEPENWPEALRQFDQMVADGHDELELSLSTKRERRLRPFWNFYVDGFGEDREAAQAYCDRFDLDFDQCFVAEV